MGTVSDASYPSQWLPVSPQAQGATSSPGTKERVKAKSASPVDEAAATVKSQIVLTKEQAVEIYGLRRVTADLSPKLAEIAGKSALVAEVYSVSPKTIRDIWNRKTWTQATRQFWTEEETSVHAFEHVKMMLPSYMPGYAPTTELMSIKQKPRGRPPGSKDSRPRKRRNVKGEGDEDSGEGESNTTSLRELRDEIAEWATSRAEHMTTGLNEPCENTTRPHEWPEQKVDILSIGPQTGEKRKASEEPKGADVEWAANTEALQPSLIQMQQCYAQPHQHLQPLQPIHQSAFQPVLAQQPVLSPPTLVQPPCNNFDMYLHDTFGVPEAQSASNLNIGPPPRLDLGLDECLRAMSTEGESLMKARVTLDQALQCSPEARVITEAHRPFKIVHVNDSWSMLCGFNKQEVMGNTLNMIQGPATDPNALRDLISRIQAREEARTMLVNYKKGGFPFLNMLQVQPLVDQEGVVTHYMGVLEDVTLKDYLHPLAHYVRDLRASLGYAQ